MLSQTVNISHDISPLHSIMTRQSNSTANYNNSHNTSKCTSSKHYTWLKYRYSFFAMMSQVYFQTDTHKHQLHLPLDGRLNLEPGYICSTDINLVSAVSSKTLRDCCHVWWLRQKQFHNATFQ